MSKQPKTNPVLSPVESGTIAELADIIKHGVDYSQLSEKEFNSMILSRRPLELILMANAIIYNNCLK